MRMNFGFRLKYNIPYLKERMIKVGAESVLIRALLIGLK